MAESYRGLTIKINGDTTKLTQALHTANQAISGTQSGLRKLSDALKLDPTSFKASQLQVGAFAEQAANAATRLTTLNEAMRQVGDSIPKGASITVRELANAWDNVNMKASEARDSFNRLTAVLATEYTQLSAISDMAAQAFGDTFSKNWKIDTNIDQIVSDIENMPEAFQKSNAKLQQFLDTVRYLQGQYAELTEAAAAYEKSMKATDDQNIIAKSAERLKEVKAQIEELGPAFERAVAKFTTFDGEVFKFDNENVDLESLKRGLDDIVKSGLRTQEWADQMYTKFQSMKYAWLEAQKSLNVANQVEGFKDLEAETTKAEAQVKSLVDNMLRLAQTSEIAKGLAGLKQELKEIEAAGNSAKSRMQEFLNIVSNNNQNKRATGEGTQTAAMQAYSDAIEAAQMKYENLIEQLKAYDGVDEWITQLANSTQSLVGITTQANENFKESATVLKTYEAALQTAHDNMQRLKDANPDDFAGMAEYQNAARTFNAWSEIVEVARQNFEKFSDALEGVNKAGEIRTLRGDASEAYETLKDLNEINVKPEIDVSSVEGLKKAVDAISKGIFDSKGSNSSGAWNFSKVAEDIHVANVALDEARNKYKALSDAFKDNPTDSDTIVQRTEALSQYTDKLKASVAAYRAQIDAIPTDKIDQVALSTGTVSEAFTRAKLEVDKLDESITQTENKIKQLTDERNSILLVNPDAKTEIANLDARILALKNRLKELQTQADVALDNLATEDNTRRVDEAQTKIQQLIAELHKLGVEVENAGQMDMPTPKIDEAAFTQVTDRIAQAARQMAQEVVQASNEIDSAYRDMRKTVNGTEEQFAALKDTAIEFSQTKVTSADIMLEMQALGGQLGVLVEDLEQFGKIGSNLDIATDMDAEDIALKLGQISNVLQLDIDGMQGFADALVRLGNNMPAQESSIMAVAQRFGAVAATANFSGEEVLAWAAAIAATGQRSEAAATAISNTVSGIEQAIANGGSTLEQFAAIAGMSSEQFKESWQKGPTEALKSFINGLQTLNESDESAVAALENMGITGVRQQQTLLALSRTIDSLDDALVMSKNAWHGVSDQWGQAGDAANEAEKKAAGFSGALAIMKNNAQNLAASLGDGFIPFMKAASDVMMVVTDILNSMPEPVKQLVVGLAGAGVAFSTITPLLNTFGKGLGATIAMFKDTASIGEFIAKLIGLNSVVESAAEGGVNLLGAFSKFGPEILAISAAAVVLGTAISATMDYYEKQETLRKSTEDLTSAINQYAVAYQSVTSGTDSAVASLTDLRAKTDEVVESQAMLVDTLSSKWEDVGTTAGMVSYYAQKINELSGQSELTASQQAELASAVEAFNDITGSGIEILDRSNGTLSESAKTISNTADAWKKMAVAEAAYEMYKDVVKQRIKDQMALEEATNNLASAQEAAGNVQGNWMQDMRDGGSVAVGAAGGVKAYEDEVNRLQSEVDAADEVIEQLWKYMEGGDQATEKMRKCLTDAGYDVTEFNNLTKEELAQLAAVFDGTIDSIVEGMKRISAARGSLAGGISLELDEASKAAAKARAELYKENATEVYNAKKAAYDAEYKLAQRGYDADYKAMQRQLDSIYKAQQKSYDNEYKSLQKSLDKQYKAKQKAFDEEYDARKKAYDNEYNALKKRLDGEYDAYKKANDKKLDALKDANDDEEDAFKKQTDTYLKELEKRYKAAVKEAEDETDARVKAIDDQIKALEDATQREKDAIEERKENDKIAELRTAVDNAKSRRKRAEAEKKLNDYLEEVRVKHNEKERKSQIDVLKEQQKDIKDQLSDRKDVLKEQYESERDAYKEARDAQLEDIKKANDAEEEALKDKLAAEEDALKESNTARLEALKEQQTAQLEALKEQQTAQLEAIKESQQAQLESLKESQQAQLEALKESQQDQLQAKKDSQSIALENMKAAHTKELQELKERQDKEYEIIKNGGTVISEETQKKLDNIQRKFEHAGTALTGKVTTMRNTLKDVFIGVADDSESNTGRAKDSIVNNMGEAAKGAAEKAIELKDGVTSQVDEIPYSGESAMSGLSASFLGQAASDAVSNAYNVASDISSSFSSLATEGEQSGYDMLTNFNAGFVAAWNARTLQDNVRNVAQYITDWMGFSVPKYGPMSDADKWGPDMVNLIADGIKSEQHKLLHQVEKMSDAIEEAFDPTLTVDAAYEALDTIGKNRSRTLATAVETSSAPNITLNISMNLSGVSMRDDSDIDKLAEAVSQKMAAQAARQLAGRLGR